MDAELITYWFEWKWRKLFGFPEYAYHWFRQAYKVRKQDILVAQIRKEIESKYQMFFMQLDLDFNGYSELKRLKEKEIEAAIKKATE